MCVVCLQTLRKIFFLLKVCSTESKNQFLALAGKPAKVTGAVILLQAVLASQALKF